MLKLSFIIGGIVFIFGAFIWGFKKTEKLIRRSKELEHQKADRKQEQRVNQAAIDGLKKEQEGFGDLENTNPDDDIFSK